MDKCTDCLLKQIKVLDGRILGIEWICEIDGLPAEGRMFCAKDISESKEIK